MRRTSDLIANDGLVDRQERRLPDTVARLEVLDREGVLPLVQDAIRHGEGALGPGRLRLPRSVVGERGRAVEDLAIVEDDRDPGPRSALRIEPDDPDLGVARAGRQVEMGRHPAKGGARAVDQGRGPSPVDRVALLAEPALEGGVLEAHLADLRRGGPARRGGGGGGGGPGWGGAGRGGGGAGAGGARAPSLGRRGGGARAVAL